MRAIRIHELSGVDALRLEEVPSLSPTPGHIRVAVHAAGVNFADTLIVTGVYQYKPDLPFTPGMEAAGTVIDVGEGVTGFTPGDRVLAPIRQGAYAEEVIVDAQHVIRMPDDMDFVTGAAFPIGYGTSHLALTHRTRLRAGEVLLVLGAAGGVGLTAVEVGKALGATVIACASSDEKLAIAKSRGADILINYATEDIRERVKATTGGADVVYDPVGGDATRAALRCLNFEGRLITLGFASGDVPQIAANYLLVKNIAVIGYVFSAYRFEKPEVMRRSLEEICAWYVEGRIKPHVSATFPLEQTPDALKLLLARKSTGKVVITVRDGG
ncbi:MAG: NADPH:quinone oxidoreductase family protein [Alphaproteobacteria bacterium]|nr:NADPH:quinone oxidoreductase family protein [Alphaproteobacteria bacterium]